MKGALEFSVVAFFSLASHISVAHSHDLFSSWEKFWNVSCQFKDIVSRSRRSVVNEPNLDDPRELFNYLYPLADVTIDDLESEKRSSDSPLSISSWIEDLVDLWETHCHTRHTRVKRRTRRPSKSRQRSNDGSNATMTDREDDLVEVGDDESEAATPSPADKSASKPAKKAIADGDTFFAQYGGDVEYFFPLISFGIPFDGEITFLGFHGFKGIFPYR